MPKGIPRNKCAQQAIIHRLKIARGHLNKVIGMVEGGSYCIDIVHQSAAVQAALRSADDVILKNHMETCVAEEIRKGHTNEVITEIMKVMENKQNG
jgi:DNA-binding FrmR family transcriptional regulator